MIVINTRLLIPEKNYFIINRKIIISYIIRIDLLNVNYIATSKMAT